MKIDILSNSVEIRLLEKLDELEKVNELERLVWADDDPVPVHQTITAAKNGGMVLGAFLDGQLVGFQYSFAGYDGKTPYLCSHILGIHPDFRIHRIGEKLKRAQREEAQKKGYKLITWTYDPLETINAHLNISKLGGVSNNYIENCYGDMTDPLNAGVPSDRLLVHWWICSERVMERSYGRRGQAQSLSDHPIAFDTARDDRGLPYPKWSGIHKQEDAILIPVPACFQQIKELDLALAVVWRMITRKAFSSYLNKGWTIVDFIKQDGPMNLGTVHYYFLCKLNDGRGK